jgi:hypothetical protein
MPYEEYERIGARSGKPAISMYPDGRVALNAHAARALAASGVKGVKFLWDSVNRKMALKAAAKGERNTFAVSIAADKRSGSLRAKGFMGHIGWSATEREMVPAVWNEKERMLEVSLPAKYLPNPSSESKTGSKVSRPA